MKKIHINVLTLIAACAAITAVSACSQEAEGAEPDIIVSPGVNLHMMTGPGPVIPGDEESSGSEESSEDTSASIPDGYFSSDTVMFSGQVLSVDTEEQLIVLDAVRTEGEGGASPEEIIFNYISGVPFLDLADSLPVNVHDLSEGDLVYAWAGDTMTLSLPPIMNLQALVTDIPEDSAIPRYIVCLDACFDEGSDILGITAQTGEVYAFSIEDTEICAFRTRQIVLPSDISAGSRLMISGDGEKITVF